MASVLLVMASNLESLAALSLVSRATNHGYGLQPVAMASHLDALASKLDVMVSNFQPTPTYFTLVGWRVANRKSFPHAISRESVCVYVTPCF